MAHLPPCIRGGRHKVAIDLTLIPYHGQAAHDPKEIRRGQAKSGTTHFHCYATAYVIKKNKHVALALTYVRADEPLIEVLERLLTRLRALGLDVVVPPFSSRRTLSPFSPSPSTSRQATLAW